MRKDAQSGKIYILSLFADYSILMEVEIDLFKGKKALERIELNRIEDALSEGKMAMWHLTPFCCVSSYPRAH